MLHKIVIIITCYYSFQEGTAAGEMVLYVQDVTINNKTDAVNQFK